MKHPSKGLLFCYLLFAIALLSFGGSGILRAQDCMISPPTDVYVSGITCNSATLNWTPATESTFQVFYKLTSADSWSPKIKVGSATSYTFNALLPDTSYKFKIVAKCPDGSKSKKIIIKASTLSCSSPPNIILILVDDSRFDYYSCNGAPSFHQTPNIDRIANEGVNFKRCLIPTALCSPSRSSIATGLFTNKTGIHYNGQDLDTSFVTIPEVLAPNGYYTAIIGKNQGQFLNGATPEYNFYMTSDHFENSDGKKFDYNGTVKTIQKEYLLTVTDTAIGLIKRTEQPLFIWLAIQAPHFPSRVLPSFEGDYDNGEPILFAADTAKYLINFPSFTYKANENNLIHGYALDSTYRDVLEEVAGIDSCIGEILKTLEDAGELDNTLVIFTSDNGFCLGNHWLKNKTFAYEPSMKVPLFIRYPKWFPGGSNIYSQFASNMDLASTMYEAAGIQSGLPAMDGFSLNELYNGTRQRTSMYYLKMHDQFDINPTVRAYRDRYYKYIYHACNSGTVEEFFDEVNDSLELTNLVNNSAYAAVLQQYRLKFDSMKLAWNDTAATVTKFCFIKNPYELRYLLEEDAPPVQPVIYPNLTAGTVEIFIPWPSADVTLFDGAGRKLSSWKISDPLTMIDLPPLAGGLYYLQFLSEGKSVTEKIIVQQ